MTESNLIDSFRPRKAKVFLQDGGISIRVILFLAVVGLGFALAWMLLLPEILATTVKRRTGFDVRIARMASNPFSGELKINELSVANPPGWTASSFIQVRELRVVFDVWSLLGSRPVIHSAYLDIESVSWVADGRSPSNLQVFSERLRGEKEIPGKAQSAPKPPELAQDFLIKELELRFGRLEWVYLSGERPLRREVIHDWRKTYREVTHSAQILAEAPAGVSAVGMLCTSLLPGPVGRVLGSALRPEEPGPKERNRKWSDPMRAAWEKLEESPKP